MLEMHIGLNYKWALALGG